MKASFVSGVIIGFAAVVAVAWYFPWVDHVRIPSKTSVLANGGRSEQFLIRLPADRVAAAVNVESAARLQRFPDTVNMPEDVGNELVLLEHFKIRDSAGDVIGVASRHTLEVNRRIATAWNLVIPSRGAMMLRGDAAASTLDRRLVDAGFQQGQPWAGDVRIPPPDAEQSTGGELMSGTGEFNMLTGRYEESWQITGVSPAGELRGTIELNTVSRGVR